MSAHTNTRSMELRRQRVIEPLANHIDRPSLVMLSRVSRRWNVGANAVLWRHLRSFVPLLRLLRPQLAGGIWVCIPICVPHKAVWLIRALLQVFESPIRASTLVRFDEIAACVHSINWSERGWSPEWLEVFASSAHLLHAMRPAHDLLPNLRSFHANCETLRGVGTIVPWLSASLHNVDIVLGLTADDAVGTYVLSALEGHSSHITSFSLRMDSSPNRRRFMAQALLAVLQGLGAVRRVTTPLFDVPSQHLNTLGAAPHLEELNLFLLESPIGGADVGMPVVDDRLDDLDELDDLHGLPEQSSSHQTSHGTPSATLGVFPSLHTLAITGFLTDIADVVRDTTQDLERLFLSVPSIQDEHEMILAMQAIASFCPRLSFITFDFFSADHPEWVNFDPLNQRPLEIHARHPRFAPNFLVLRIDGNGVVEPQILPDYI
ncbi:hypothetical protein PILCRDRAFT_1343 [Piloderma croceum F 1598]|uniref:F-box domain-containing protein n=1 Tax=Piloderma croceum (strain F 1598) TaxID=765440 RepID=A0A0C3BXB1_PILCF|nr:hypothetical protein PILCRDRAFT_1343 [Piloderma croceum F 1598]